MHCQLYIKKLTPSNNFSSLHIPSTHPILLLNLPCHMHSPDPWNQLTLSSLLTLSQLSFSNLICTTSPWFKPTLFLSNSVLFNFDVFFQLEFYYTPCKVICMDVRKGGGKVYGLGDIERKKVIGAIKNLVWKSIGHRWHNSRNMEGIL